MAKVLQITDLHILRHPDETLLGVNTEYYFDQVLQQAHARHQQFGLILLTGDLAQTPCIEAYQRIQAYLTPYSTPIFCVAGNHDFPEVMQQVFQLKTRTTIGDWQIIALHSPIVGSPVGALAPLELVKLSRQLRQHPTIPTLLTMHHPCVPCGSAWMDTMQIQNSEALWKLLADFPQVKAITCGHIHQEMALTKNDVQVFAAPATCFQFLPHSTDFAVADTRPGYRVFEFQGDAFSSYCEYIDAPEFQANPGASNSY